MPSVREIAELAGVSLSTVSLVLNNKPGVSDAMRTKINQVIQTLDSGYSTTNNQSVYSNTKKLSIVVLHPQILRSSEVFNEFLQGIEAAANSMDIHLRFLTNQDSAPENDLTNLYFTNPNLKPDGVIVIGHRQDQPIPKGITISNIPCVFVGREPNGNTISTIGPDEFAITYNATQYLISLGHTTIALLGGDSSYSYTHNRIRGYQKALIDNKIDFKEDWVALGPGEQAAQTVLLNAPEITAVLIINDTHAKEALPILQSAGKIIPKNLSVISFDDTDFAKNFDPPLTSVAYPRYLQGYQAVKMIYEKVQNPSLQSFHVFVTASIIKRSSCKQI